MDSGAITAWGGAISVVIGACSIAIWRLKKQNIELKKQADEADAKRLQATRDYEAKRNQTDKENEASAIAEYRNLIQMFKRDKNSLLKEVMDGQERILKLEVETAVQKQRIGEQQERLSHVILSHDADENRCKEDRERMIGEINKLEKTCAELQSIIRDLKLSREV